MQRSRRSALQRLGLALPAIALASCSFPPFLHARATAPPVSLTLYYGPFSAIAGGTPPEDTVMSEIAKSYEQHHPNIHLTVRSISDVSSGNLAQLFNPLSNDHGDLFLSLSTLPAMDTPDIPISLTNVITPVDSYLKRDGTVTEKTFYSAAIARNTIDGKVVGLPRDIQPEQAVFFNDDLLTVAGLRPPGGDWSTNNFLSMTQTLTRVFQGKSPLSIRFGYADENELNSLYDFIYVFGGRRVTNPPAAPRIALDSADAIRGAQFYVDLHTRYQVAPLPIARTGLYETNPLIDFMLGHISLLVAPTQVIATLHSMKRKLNWNLALLPTTASVAQSWDGVGANIYLARISSHLDEAWAVAKDLCAGNGMKTRAAVGDVHPAAKAIAESPAYLQAGSPSGIRLFNTIGMQHMIAVDPSLSLARLGLIGPFQGPKQPQYAAAERVLRDNLNDMLSGRASPAAVLREATQTGNAGLS
ncbi:MAG: extracellular solute-binding protein [Chloroflexi bacterium]|nr:extracellular solute-binding protein [Chloroflexota bacterium]